MLYHQAIYFYSLNVKLWLRGCGGLIVNALVLRMKVKKGKEMLCKLQDRLGGIFLYFLTFMCVRACAHALKCVQKEVEADTERNNYQEEKPGRAVSG